MTDISLAGVNLSDAVPSAVIRSVTRGLVGRRRDVSVDVPGRAGAWRFPEQPGDRTLSVDIHIAADTFAERRAAVTALADWADPGTVAALIVDDEPDRYHDALLASTPSPPEWLLAAGVTLEFTVGPYSNASTLSDVDLVADTNPDSGTFTGPATISADPVLELEPVGGNLTGFDLTVDGRLLRWEGPTVAAGVIVTVSSLSDAVTLGANTDVELTGAISAGTVVMADVSGEFPTLPTGSVSWSLAWTGTATSVNITAAWRERHR